MSDNKHHRKQTVQEITVTDPKVGRLCSLTRQVSSLCDRVTQMSLSSSPKVLQAADEIEQGLQQAIAGLQSAVLDGKKKSGESRSRRAQRKVANGKVKRGKARELKVVAGQVSEDSAAPGTTPEAKDTKPAAAAKPPAKKAPAKKAPAKKAVAKKPAARTSAKTAAS